MRKAQLFSLIKTLLTALVVLPISLFMMPFVRRKHIDSSHFFALGVDHERYPDETLKMVQELGVSTLVVRHKLWEMESLAELKSFLLACENKRIILKILQDRENIENLELFKTNLRRIFTELQGLVHIYEIGSTINRAKWGFFSVDEYGRFFQTAFELRNTEFSHAKLIGSGVIDFEYHFSAHTLFNLFKYRYDGVSSLLYVDRRGAPENIQMGFNLSDKIALLSTMVWLSPKSRHRLYITETNWPISNTAPYAPTSEHECVSEEQYANYMLRYYLLAFASQQVNVCSWHQLIAPGYGLVDSREGLRKREAFETYGYMIQTLKDAQFLRMDIKRGYHIFQALLANDTLLQIHWSLKPTTIRNESDYEVFDKNANPIQAKELHIGDSPLYIYIKSKHEHS